MAGLVAAFQKELQPYEILKGTIKFPLSKGVPAKLIEQLARFRAKEVAASAKAKKTVPKKAATKKVATRKKR